MTATPVQIRRATAADASGIAVVHIAAIRELCGLVYGAEQIDAWLSGKGPEKYLEPIAKNPFFVAVSGTQIVGFSECDLATGEVRAVYVHPEHVRQGIGAGLLQAVEAAARAHSLDRLSLHASLNSVGFYQAHSYVSDGEARHVLRNGVELPCMAMHKRLGRAAS